MRLELYNFKCYRSKILDLPDKGLLLLSAPSGTGKSTIFKAILFALFGIGKKLCLWGKKSCRVVLTINIEKIEYCITRTKCPNRLVVEYSGNEYEDAVAQNIINNVFGQNFVDTSFVDNQNIYKSFLMMSPTDKLTFLENFALRNSNIKSIKQKIKGEIKEKNEELTEINININAKNDTLEHFPEQELGEFPLKYKNRDKVIKNQRVKKKNRSIMAKSSRTILEKLRKQYKILNDKYYKNELNIMRVKNLRSEKEKLENRIDENKVYILSDKTVKEYRQFIENAKKLKAKKDLEKDVSKLEEQIKIGKKSEIDELKTKIEKINKCITSDPKHINGQLSTLQQVKPKFVDYKKLEKELKEYEDTTEDDIPVFEKQLAEITEKLEGLYKELHDAEISEKILECPNCTQKLYLNDNSLKVVTNVNTTIDKKKVQSLLSGCKKRQQDFTKMIEDYRQNIIKKKELTEKIESIVSFLQERGYDPKKESLNKIVENIDSLTNILQVLEKSIEKKAELETLLINEKYSQSIVNMEKDLSKKLNELEKFVDLSEIVTDKNTREIERELEKHKECEKLVGNLEKQIKNIENEISSIEIDDIDYSILEKLQSDIDSEIKNESRYIREEEELESIIEKIDEFLEKEKIQKNREKILSDIENLKLSEKTALERYNAALKLKEKVLEAESASTNNVINTINEYVSYYLSKFFIEENMVIELIPYKLKKSTLKENVNKKEYIEKPQINVKMIYKNEECDISSLSGGETARVVLAFTFALAKMFDSKLLLLDEATANLDHENTQNVFSVIKEEFSDNFVMAVAHQVVEGSYDHVIYL